MGTTYTFKCGMPRCADRLVMAGYPSEAMARHAARTQCGWEYLFSSEVWLCHFHGVVHRQDWEWQPARMRRHEEDCTYNRLFVCICADRPRAPLGIDTAGQGIGPDDYRRGIQVVRPKEEFL